MDGVTAQGPTDPSGGPPGDPLRDVPLFREIQRVLMASTGPVNWELARQVGIASASWGADDPGPSEDERLSLEQTVRAAELSVADVTALPMPPEVARVELVRRAQWVESSIASLRDVIEPENPDVRAIGECARHQGVIEDRGTCATFPDLSWAGWKTPAPASADRGTCRWRQRPWPGWLIRMGYDCPAAARS